MVKLFLPRELLFSGYIVPSFREFARFICANSRDLNKEYGIDLHLFDDQSILSDGDVFLTHGLTGVDQRVIDKCQIYSFWDDLHYYNEKQQAQRHRLFKLAHKLLLTYSDNFKINDEYSEYFSKAVSFPWFSAFQFPEPTFQEWKARHNQFLLSGRMTEPYVLRRAILSRFKGLEIMHHQKHPGYNDKQDSNAILGLDYYRMISEFKAGIATSAWHPSIDLRYSVAKYFEIPSVGSLLIGEFLPELKSLGFLDGDNCILIQGEEGFESIREVFYNIDSYFEIAISGKRLIDSRHSLRARYQLLCNIIIKG